MKRSLERGDERWLKVKQEGWTVEDDRWQRRIRAVPSARRG
jgi:hypothetical protein